MILLCANLLTVVSLQRLTVYLQGLLSSSHCVAYIRTRLHNENKAASRVLINRAVADVTLLFLRRVLLGRIQPVADLLVQNVMEERLCLPVVDQQPAKKSRPTEEAVCSAQTRTDLARLVLSFLTTRNCVASISANRDMIVGQVTAAAETVASTRAVYGHLENKTAALTYEIECLATKKAILVDDNQLLQEHQDSLRNDIDAIETLNAENDHLLTNLSTLRQSRKAAVSTAKQANL